MDVNGRESGEEAFQASFPHLIDVGIMGHCRHGMTGACREAGGQCYQDGPHRYQDNMPLADFKNIAWQCRGKVYQFALGGRGDPDQHEHFAEILAVCAENRIVPNFTSSGFGITAKTAAMCRQYCGAVAISWYSRDYTTRAVSLLQEAGVKTNIHFVLGRGTLDEALFLLRRDGFPAGVNAVVFLLHKPVGLGRRGNVLDLDDPQMKDFFHTVVQGSWRFKVGFDSCTVPGLINLGQNINFQAADTCEGARFSCYITPDMKLLPCSFDQKHRWACDISMISIQEAWRSSSFEDFRMRLRTACGGCEDRELCLGGCPLAQEIVLCKRNERRNNAYPYTPACAEDKNPSL